MLSTVKVSSPQFTWNMRIHLVLQRPHLLQRELVQLLVEPGLHGRVVGAQVVHRLNDPLHLLHALALTGPDGGRRGDGRLDGGDDAVKRAEGGERDQQQRQQHHRVNGGQVEVILHAVQL